MTDDSNIFIYWSKLHVNTTTGCLFWSSYVQIVHMTRLAANKKANPIKAKQCRLIKVIKWPRISSQNASSLSGAKVHVLSSVICTDSLCCVAPAGSGSAQVSLSLGAHLCQTAAHRHSDIVQDKKKKKKKLSQRLETNQFLDQGLIDTIRVFENKIDKTGFFFFKFLNKTKQIKKDQKLTQQNWSNVKEAAQINVSDKKSQTKCLYSRWNVLFFRTNSNFP